MSDGTTTANDNIGALWVSEDAQGNKYFSGSIDMPDGTRQKVVIFKNTFKQPGESSPDWRIKKSKPRTQAGGEL